MIWDGAVIVGGGVATIWKFATYLSSATGVPSFLLFAALLIVSAIIAVKTLAIVFCVALDAARLGVDRLTAFLAALILAAVSATGRIVLALLQIVLVWPLALLRDRLHDAAARATAGVMERLAQYRELQRLWREEYRDQFKTFREFREAFEQGGSNGKGTGAGAPEEPRGVDAFAGACRLLGLSEDGSFSRAEMTARYRKLMQGIHPDAGGSAVLAAQVNAARDAIRKGKGW